MKFFINKEDRKIQLEEAYASACAKVDLLLNSPENCKIVMVANVYSKNNTTQVAEKLARTFGERHNNKVLLIDYDLLSTDEIHAGSFKVFQITPVYSVAPMALHTSNQTPALTGTYPSLQLATDELCQTYTHIIINVPRHEKIADAVMLLKKPMVSIVSLALCKSRNKDIRKTVELLEMLAIPVLGAIVNE